ncbi:class II fructose-bisphosphate aldolase family protein [Sporosarcina aquimarina]|uniref:class II fructose-bisphosphate aldolase n=1 Tax=Sporosarcina aquimarina TaxID=114975 RepID=UPI00203D263C|nr:class II fructose-bisphosphate aldolase [Sporosarcina aquimarina]MCM3758409.1 class II fructose-bisphosphate aldolase family protein [Sporosarcina aquimarina]
MTLVTTKEILEDAYANQYAIGAFGVHNLEIMKAIIAGAEAAGAPVILQTTSSTYKYFEMPYLIALANAAAERSSVPVALHLDHGESLKHVMECLRAGYTSVMIDGSRLPFEENIELVKRVVEVSKSVSIPVEAELGTIGGVEDDQVVDETKSLFTNPEMAERFVHETGIDSFAPAFGTAHGAYREEPKLQFDLLDQIRQATNVPLVMHGASGVSEESVRKAIGLGVSKVNFSTELKDLFAEKLRSYFVEYPAENDPRKYFLPAREALAKLVEQKVRMLQR